MERPVHRAVADADAALRDDLVDIADKSPVDRALHGASAVVITVAGKPAILNWPQRQ
jgi:hypothetical protein